MPNNKIVTLGDYVKQSEERYKEIEKRLEALEKTTDGLRAKPYYETRYRVK